MKTEDIYNDLCKRDHIGYGKYIPRKVFEQFWGPYENVGTQKGWAWYGQWALLKEYIEKKGYFTTSRGVQQGSLRILSLNEMPNRAKNKLKTLKKRANRTSSSIQNAKTECLNEFDKAKLHHVLNLTNLYAQSVNSVLHDI